MSLGPSASSASVWLYVGSCQVWSGVYDLLQHQSTNTLHHSLLHNIKHPPPCLGSAARCHDYTGVIHRWRIFYRGMGGSMRIWPRIKMNDGLLIDGFFTPYWQPRPYSWRELFKKINSVNTFTQNVKAYNYFVLIDIYELKKLTVI